MDPKIRIESMLGVSNDSSSLGGEQKWFPWEGVHFDYDYVCLIS